MARGLQGGARNATSTRIDSDGRLNAMIQKSPARWFIEEEIEEVRTRKNTRRSRRDVGTAEGDSDHGGAWADRTNVVAHYGQVGVEVSASAASCKREALRAASAGPRRSRVVTGVGTNSPAHGPRSRWSIRVRAAIRSEIGRIAAMGGRRRMIASLRSGSRKGGEAARAVALPRGRGGGEGAGPRVAGPHPWVIEIRMGYQCPPTGFSRRLPSA